MFCAENLPSTAIKGAILWPIGASQFSFQIIGPARRDVGMLSDDNFCVKSLNLFVCELVLRIIVECVNT